MEAPIQFFHTLPRILCCICGIEIESNPSNMCVNCIRNQVDITEGISKQLTIHFCRACGKYLQPPNHWTFCELESKELLAILLKKVKGLSKVKLIDAGFVWTEPHSRRIKIKITVQKEVFLSTILQQAFIIEFVVQTQQCPQCTQQQTNQGTWTAVVQVRQRIEHKKTFYFLEQLILKHSAHQNTLSIKEQPDGIDFYFGHRSHALKFVDFLQAVTPIRYKTSEKLISQDEHSNTYNYKYTFAVEISPICREDLVCLPLKFALSAGNISPLVLCWKISNVIHIIDPISLAVTDINAGTYWKYGFRSLSTSKQLVPFIVLDITPLGPVNGKFVMADVQVARESDFGKNDTLFITRTHLGHLLKPGDTVLGYDVACANYNDSDLDGLRGTRRQLPDVVLVRKTYPNRRRKRVARYWKLKDLPKEEMELTRKADIQKANVEYEEFLRDLEEDPELRSTINLYKVPNAEAIKAQPSDSMADEEEEQDEEDEDFPEVKLEELLEEMTLEDKQLPSAVKVSDFSQRHTVD